MFKNVVGIASNKLEDWNGIVWDACICVETTSKEYHNCCPCQKLQINILIETQARVSYHKSNYNLHVFIQYNVVEAS